LTSHGESCLPASLLEVNASTDTLGSATCKVCMKACKKVRVVSSVVQMNWQFSFKKSFETFQTVFLPRIVKCGKVDRYGRNLGQRQFFPSSRNAVQIRLVLVIIYTDVSLYRRSWTRQSQRESRSYSIRSSPSTAAKLSVSTLARSLPFTSFCSNSLITLN
jgi:hypothetical protein